jgi:phosphonate transport system substrate-binding protein
MKAIGSTYQIFACKVKNFSQVSIMLIFIFLCQTAITGCNNTEPVLPKDALNNGDSENQGQTLLIGLIPERNIFKQLERYEPLADYLSKEIGVNVKLKILTRYGNIIDNFVSLGLDGAFLGSFTYTLAHAKLGVEPIARPETKEGISTYYGLIFVRKDSGIETAKDMEGRIFAFVDKATTAGYLLPIAYFSENGIKDHNTYLKETYFSGTHDDTIYDVLHGEADIGAAKNTVYYKLAATDKRIEKELLILRRSPDVPENGLAVRNNLDPTLKKKLKETLLDMHNNPFGKNILINFGAKNFIETTDSDYEGVYKYVELTGLNLETYDYIND